MSNHTQQHLVDILYHQLTLYYLWWDDIPPTYLNNIPDLPISLPLQKLLTLLPCLPTFKYK